MSKMTLQKRLSYHVGKNLAIDAVDFASEAGRLQKVFMSVWIKVSGVYFVSQSLNQIVLYQISTDFSGPHVNVRSTYRGAFEAIYVGKGSDYLEVIVDEMSAGKRRLLIPLNKIISVEF